LCAGLCGEVGRGEYLHEVVDRDVVAGFALPDTGPFDDCELVLLETVPNAFVDRVVGNADISRALEVLEDLGVADGRDLGLDAVFIGYFDAAFDHEFFEFGARTPLSRSGCIFSHGGSIRRQSARGKTCKHCSRSTTTTAHFWY
jgi:hypothetical protein